MPKRNRTLNSGYNSGYNSNTGEGDPIGYLKLVVESVLSKEPESAGREESDAHNKIALISEIQHVIGQANDLIKKVEPYKDKLTIQQLIKDLEARQGHIESTIHYANANSDDEVEDEDEDLYTSVKELSDKIDEINVKRKEVPANQLGSLHPDHKKSLLTEIENARKYSKNLIKNNAEGVSELLKQLDTIETQITANIGGGGGGGLFRGGRRNTRSRQNKKNRKSRKSKSRKSRRN